jgi:hypothetical protein
VTSLELSALVGFVAMAAARRRRMRRRAVTRLPTNVPPQAKAEPTSLPVPAGWRRMKAEEVTGAHGAFATRMLATIGEIGELRVGEVEGKRVAAWTEWHFHEAGGPVKPWGWHRGITLLVRTE